MVDSKKKKASSTANTPHGWELEGDGSSRVRDPSPAPSNPRSVPQRPSIIRRTSNMDAPAAEGRYSESAESTGTVRRIGVDADNRTAEQEIDSAAEQGGPAGKQFSRASSAASSIRGRIISPEKKTRKLPMSRRGSAIPGSHQKPRPEFSVDDNMSEVEEDLHHHRVLSSAIGSTSFANMRRHSLLRRRTTGQGTIDRGDDNDRPMESESEADEDIHEDEEEGFTAKGRSYEPSEADSMESFTLKDRQQAINETHPFGIRIWKPALYKKDRSVQRTAEGDIHSAPGGRVGTILGLANILWVIVFGWWLALASFAGGLCCYVFLWTDSGRAYGNVLLGLSWYLFYPFGQFVELKQEEAYMEEDEGEGRSISEYEQWQAGDLEVGRSFFGPHTPRSLIGRRRDSIDTAGESDSLLGTHDRTGYTGEDSPTRGATKRRLFGRGEWNIGRIIFFVWFYAIIAPLLLLVSGLCWWMVFTIPMAKVTSLLFSHLRRHPLALSFHSDYSYSRPSTGSILLCTYRAVGWKYYKYTIDGTNIFFINLMSVVFFVIADHYILAEGMGLKSWITAPGTIFTLALFSVIPLAYFIGQAVASISAQSSMGMGATINAFFSTVVEVFLYCVALGEGKARLVEGSIVGSILAGILFMPGLSMCSGAIKRKTQRFNANSAGVTSTMLLYAVIGAFAPTLFYQIYGTYELSCTSCTGKVDTEDCRRCIFSQTPTATDRFYHEAVLPFTYIASIFLFISYLIGLWFTLRTHAAIIWQVPPATTAAPTAVHPTIAAAPNRLPQREQDGVGQQGGYQSESARNTANMRDSVLYKRILGQSLSGVGYRSDGAVPTPVTAPSTHPGQSLHVVPPRSVGDDIMSGPLLRNPPVSIPGLSSEQNAKLVRGVAEVAAAAATAAVQDVQRQHETQYGTVRKIQPHTTVTTDVARVSQPTAVATPAFELDGFIGGAEAVHGGHDAPNWGKHKSAVILLGATVLYAIIAEILVKTVDVVLENFDIDEKFLGITLFALVPNTTEFLNAISFAMNGNIALSMEIGSAYALQVCLLQIPALVAWSVYFSSTIPADQVFSHTFNLVFPQWDLVTVILCVFLLSYMYGEGKSNYFKGSILILSYLTVMLGFYFSSYADPSVDMKKNGGPGYKVIGSGSRAYGVAFEMGGRA